MVNDYWKKRIEAEQKARIERDATLADEMGRLYDYHFKELEKEIRAFEQRYMEKNNIPLSELKTRVSEMDVRAFEEKAKRYVTEKNFSTRANAELGLYNLKMKTSRLELLQYQMDLEMLALTNGEHKLTERFLNEEYIKELENQAGLLGRSVLSANQLAQVAQTTINTPFKGAVWSDKIWQRQEALREIVAHMTEDYLLKGKNPTTMIAQIRREFDVSASQAKRLAITEGARVASEAQKQAYIANGYNEYEFIAEPSACGLCKPLDGKIFKVKDMEPSLNASPVHPYCRCATAAHGLENRDLELASVDKMGYNLNMESSEELAKSILRDVSAQESDITRLMSRVSQNNNGRLEGLEFKLKSVESLARKIETDAALDGVSLVQASSQVNDVLRYTTILDQETFGQDYARMRLDLKNSGLEIKKVKNTWMDDGPYKGVNTILEKDGIAFEVQYHTQESFDLKNGKLHELYEERRLPTISQQRKLELDREMMRLSKNLTVPSGIEGVE